MDFLFATSAAQHAPSSSPPTVAYLVQGPASSFPRIWNLFQNVTHAHLYFYSFDRPVVVGKRSSNSNNQHPAICLFQPNTSFHQGRHLLLRRALKDQQVHNILYYVFVDDDVQLLCEASLKRVRVGRYRIGTRFASAAFAARRDAEVEPTVSTNQREQAYCWQKYTHKVLLQNETRNVVNNNNNNNNNSEAAAHPYEWPLQRPGTLRFDTMDVFTFRWQTCVDQNVQAIHRDYLWLLFPVSYKDLDKSWHIQGKTRHMIAQRCFPHAWKVNGFFMVSNPQHTNYPQNRSRPLVFAYLNYTYGALGPWNETTMDQCPPKHRCQVAEHAPIHYRLDRGGLNKAMDTTCRETLQKRYQSWLQGTFEPEFQRPEIASVETTT